MAIKLEAARGDFTAVAGLTIFSQIFDSLDLKNKITPYLPGSHSQKILQRNFQKFRCMTLGLVAGAECLDDMNVLHGDIGFNAACKDNTFSPNTYGEFLRAFEKWHPERLNDVLISTALKLREKAHGKVRDFILDIDSTDHEQYGKKIEGVAYNYKNHWCLDSLQAFDQFGFQYWMDVRPGNTYTSNDSPRVIERVFRQIPKKNTLRFLRGDSGFCNHAVMNKCMEYNVSFVLAMRENMSDPLKQNVTNWRPTNSVLFKDGRECEIGSTVYYPEGVKGAMRVVLIRAKKFQPTFFERYDYHAWVTNMGEHEMNNEKLIDFYKKRGNAENFIRELKNGFDMHHFPCQSLNANKVYGIITAFSYNLMRLSAWFVDGKKPRFSKMLRFRMVYIAGQVVKKARNLIIRINKHQYQEVIHWMTTLQKKYGYG
jgi:hypothetical protein